MYRSFGIATALVVLLAFGIPGGARAQGPTSGSGPSFELTPYGNETQVTITQSNLIGGATASDIEHRAEYEKNWTGVLEGLAQLFP